MTAQNVVEVVTLDPTSINTVDAARAYIAGGGKKYDLSQDIQKALAVLADTPAKRVHLPAEFQENVPSKGTRKGKANPKAKDENGEKGKGEPRRERPVSPEDVTTISAAMSVAAPAKVATPARPSNGQRHNGNSHYNRDEISPADLAAAKAVADAVLAKLTFRQDLVEIAKVEKETAKVAGVVLVAMEKWLNASAHQLRGILITTKSPEWQAALQKARDVMSTMAFNEYQRAIKAELVATVAINYAEVNADLRTAVDTAIAGFTSAHPGNEGRVSSAYLQAKDGARKAGFTKQVEDEVGVSLPTL